MKIKRVDGVDNIGAYLTAYLADLELTPETMAVAFQTGHDVVEKEIDGQKKAFIKGGRLHVSIRYEPVQKVKRDCLS